MPPPAGYGGALLTGFYAALDALDWDAAALLLTADVRWHVLGDAPETVVGRDAVRAWWATAYGGADLHRTITAVRDEGTAAAVFGDLESGAGEDRTTSGWLASFRFEEGLIAEHVSLHIG